jgi:hypothetical protein
MLHVCKNIVLNIFELLSQIPNHHRNWKVEKLTKAIQRARIHKETFKFVDIQEVNIQICRHP